MKIEDIAKVCHQANKAFCEGIGDDSKVPWNVLPKEEQDGVVSGVQFRLDNPNESAKAQHKHWYKALEAEGWTYGDQKNKKAKKHPCMVSYADLSARHLAKDFMFMSIVDHLRDFVGEDEKATEKPIIEVPFKETVYTDTKAGENTFKPEKTKKVKKAKKRPYHIDF